jgi:serine phosphatase RsbU (regulator of sigma subunit)
VPDDFTEWLARSTSQTGLLVSQQNRQPCAVLFIYTDGITEANNAAGEEFGESRLV